MDEGQKYSLTRLAYHEAGHAVISSVLGLSIKHVECTPLKGFAAHEPLFLDITPDMMSPSSWKKIKTKALVLMAGEAAERAYAEIIEDSIGLCYSEYDQQEFSELRDRLGEHANAPFELSWIKMQPDIDLLINQHWHAIENVAIELRKRGNLTASEFSEILENVAQRRSMVWD